MANISVEHIQKLRAETGAGMMNAKTALEEAEGNYEQAIVILRKKGEASATKKADRSAEQGLIDTYVHNGKIGVLVELSCETDFVARTDDFVQLAHDLAMHVAASDPQYLSIEDVPPGELKHESGLYSAEATESGKPAEVIEKIVRGKLQKYYAQICLNEQPFLKDPDITVDKHVKSLIAKLGENIVVRRFVRFELGETS